ncbi:MAG TPA: hypothetical protein VIG32_09910 [Candidatus Baltobacteraceae bacterium]|jgi:hypothetical protein
MKFKWMETERHLARRSWTDDERRKVWRGLTGRFAIAIEPLLGTLFFSLLTWGIVWRANHSSQHDLVVLAPCFAFVALLFAGYLFAVLFAPVRAYVHTFKPIFIVDGYVRYRAPDVESEEESTGYVAVLFEDRGVACEWECFGKKPLPELVVPAMAEFSTFGGIHKIDGRSTGVLPDEEIPLLAIGIAPRR